MPKVALDQTEFMKALQEGSSLPKWDPSTNFFDYAHQIPGYENLEPWEPGHEGKAIASPKGVVAWKVGKPEWNYHHGDVGSWLGKDFQPRAYYAIQPDGQFTSFVANRQDKMLQQAYPGTKPESDMDWNLSKVAYTPDIKIHVVDDTGSASWDNYGPNAAEFEKRRPFIVDNDHVYLGGYDQTHEEAMESHEINYGSSRGAITDDGAWGKPARTTFFDRRLKPEWQQAIADKISEHLGTPYPLEIPKEQWNFAKVADGHIQVHDVSLPHWKDSVETEANEDNAPEGFEDVPHSYYYSPSERKVWIGNGWTHHADITRNHQIPSDAEPGLYHPKHGILYQDLNIDKPEVEDALSEHYGQVPTNWNLSKTAMHPDDKAFLENQGWKILPPTPSLGRFVDWEDPAKRTEWGYGSTDARGYDIHHMDMINALHGRNWPFKGMGFTKPAISDEEWNFSSLAHHLHVGFDKAQVPSTGRHEETNSSDAAKDPLNRGRNANAQQYEPDSPSHKEGNKGLPVVDELSHTSSLAHPFMPWQPRTYGKGILTRGNELHHWQVDDKGFGRPHHLEGIQELNIRDPEAYVYFEPDGTFGTEPVHANESQEKSDEWDDRIMNLNPQTRLPGQWDFTSSSEPSWSLLSASEPEVEYSPTLHITLPKAASSWDPLICEHCGGPMTEPKMIGNKYMNHCLKCGAYREVPPNSPMLKQKILQDQIQPYPDLLNQVGPQRGWAFSNERKENGILQSYVVDGNEMVNDQGSMAASKEAAFDDSELDLQKVRFEHIPGNPNVIKVHGGMGDAQYGWRTPVIWEPKINTVRIGSPGAYHYNLLPLHHDPYSGVYTDPLKDLTKGYTEGWISHPNVLKDEYHKDWEAPQRDAYGLQMKSTSPEHLEHIRKALIPHEPYARATVPFEESSQWDFTGKLAAEMPWGQEFDDWQATKPGYNTLGNQLGYDPAVHSEGKGFLMNDGSLWTWPTKDLRPMHMEYSKKLKRVGLQPEQAIHIGPRGEIWQYGEGRDLNLKHKQQIQAADPRLNFADDNWALSKVAAHSLGWEPGNEGKGLLFNDGSFHTWNTDSVGQPNHVPYLKSIGNELGDNVKAYLHISPEGKLYHSDYFTPGANRTVQEAAALDPRLTPNTGSMWELRSNFKTTIPESRWAI